MYNAFGLVVQEMATLASWLLAFKTPIYAMEIQFSPNRANHPSLDVFDVDYSPGPVVHCCQARLQNHYRQAEAVGTPVPVSAWRRWSAGDRRCPVVYWASM